MRMEADRRADVGVPGHEVHAGAHLGLAGRVGSGAQLFLLGAPGLGEVAVQVQALGVAVDAHHEAVVVLDQTLGHQPVIGPAELAGLARHQQPRLLGVGLPAAMRVAHAHGQDASVAVDVLGR